MASSQKNSSASQGTTRGRVLAIDYGRKRVGLALSDEMRLTARPAETLVRTNRRDDVRRLRDVVRKNGVRQIVVGYPVRLDGSAGEMAEEAARFAKRIQKELGLPVEMVDERLSSWKAEETLAATEGTRKKGETGFDAVAAAVILRDYLEREQTQKQTKK